MIVQWSDLSRGAPAGCDVVTEVRHYEGQHALASGREGYMLPESISLTKLLRSQSSPRRPVSSAPVSILTIKVARQVDVATVCARFV